MASHLEVSHVEAPRVGLDTRVPSAPAGVTEDGPQGPTFGPEIELRSWNQLPLLIFYVIVIPLFLLHPLVLPFTPLILLAYARYGKKLVRYTLLLPANLLRNRDFARLLRQLEALRRGRGDFTLTPFRNRWGKEGVRVTYEDGEWWALSKDNTVVEVTALGGTLDDWERRLPRWQEDIFATARAVGVTPARFGNLTNGGHLNLGLASCFQGDVGLLRDFFVDFTNHSEIASGILLNDPISAPAIARSRRKRRRFAAAMARIDAQPRPTMAGFIEIINARVYQGQAYDQALSLKTAWTGEDRREAAEQVLEIRAIRCQQSLQELILLARLFSARLDHLQRLRRTTGQPLAYHDRPPIRRPATALAAWHRYVTEAGLRWEDYDRFLVGRFRGHERRSDGTFARPRASLPTTCLNLVRDLVAV